MQFLVIVPAPIQGLEPITLLDVSFTYFSSTLLREGRGEKRKIIITAHSIINVKHKKKPLGSVSS